MSGVFSLPCVICLLNSEQRELSLIFQTFPELADNEVKGIYTEAVIYITL